MLSGWAIGLALLTMWPADKRFPAYLPAAQIQALAIQYEVLDPRETRYILARTEDADSDLKLLRSRWHELAGAPYVADSERFPAKAEVDDLLAFNRGYRNYLEMRLPLDPLHVWELREAIAETNQLYEIWDAVRDVRCEYYYVTVRRLALKRLRELLGPEAYYAGRLPPCVPLWRFREVDR